MNDKIVLPPHLELEGVKLIFKNLKGEKTLYKPAGYRGFSVLIEDHDMAAHLISLGWPLKQLNPPDADFPDDFSYHLPVRVNFDSRYPPQVFRVKGEDVLPLTESSVAMLDHATIMYADLDIAPNEWHVQGNSGISAYLNTMYAVVRQTRLDAKYAGFNYVNPGVA